MSKNAPSIPFESAFLVLFNCIIIIILYFVSEIIRDSTFLWDLCRLLFYHLNDFHIHSILYVLNLLSSHSCFYNKSEIITCPFNVSLHIFILCYMRYFYSIHLWVIHLFSLLPVSVLSDLWSSFLSTGLLRLAKVSFFTGTFTHHTTDILIKIWNYTVHGTDLLLNLYF